MESDDSQRVLVIETECFPSAWTSAVLWRVVTIPHMRTNVLEENGTVQGFVMVGTESGTVNIWNLAVAKAKRRRGHGTALLQWVLDLARREGHREVGLSVREGNLGAQLAYRRAGFRAVEIKHLGYGDEDAYEMRLDLSSGST